MARIIWSWQCCRLLVGNIANGIASKNFFAFLTELGNFKQKIFWRQCHWQCCQTKVCSIAKSRWFGPLLSIYRGEDLFYHPNNILLPSPPKLDAALSKMENEWIGQGFDPSIFDCCYRKVRGEKDERWMRCEYIWLKIRVTKETTRGSVCLCCPSVVSILGTQEFWGGICK